ncbi:hypothetical protein GEV33_003539 [Tenebrio molitor]|uniref:THAP-type domain-containing protein n=1 Tax=Tenebrio molitor TaxID=7067 RepID=A0A8J6HRY8_TENMO|nr:hypothetical protein GEV33_003539 [Tenebrio molitor]
MPRNCYLCLLNSKPSKRPQWPNNHHISLHKFPKDVRIRKAWFKACGLSEETDDVSKVTICSVHFTPNDYIEPYAKIIQGKMCLKREAVPSVSVPHPPSPSTLKRNEMPLLRATLSRVGNLTPHVVEDNTLGYSVMEEPREGNDGNPRRAHRCLLHISCTRCSALTTEPYTLIIGINKDKNIVQEKSAFRFFKMEPKNEPQGLDFLDSSSSLSASPSSDPRRLHALFSPLNHSPLLATEGYDWRAEGEPVTF